MPTPAGRLPPAPGADLHQLEPNVGHPRNYSAAKKTKKEKKDRNDKKDRKQRKETTSGKEPRHGNAPHRRTSPNVVKLPPARTEVQRGAATRGPAAEGAKVVNAIMQGTDPASRKKGQGKERPPTTVSVWLQLAKLIAAIVFALGYAALVVFLFLEVSKSNEDVSNDAEHSERCSRLQCPSDSICVDRSGHGHLQCSQTSYQNAQLMQIVLGVVVGIPAVICLPCSAQWLFRTGGPAFCTWYSESRRRHRVEASKKGLKKCVSSEMLTADSPRFPEDLEPGEVIDDAKATRRKPGFFGRLWSRFGSTGNAESDEVVISPTASDKQKTAREKKFAEMDADLHQVGDANDDDILDHIFANPKKQERSPQQRGAKGKHSSQTAASDEEDDFLDLIFASRKELPNHPPPLPPPDAPLEPPDEDLADTAPLDAIFAKNARKGKGGGDRNVDDESFGDFFHRPPHREKKTRGSKRKEGPLPSMPASAPRRQQAGGDDENRSRTEFSAGLSAIFATATKKTPGSRISDGSKFSKPPDSTASSQQEDFYVENEEVEDYGEAPDFIGFALGIARAAPGAGDDAKSSVAGSDIFGMPRDEDSDAQSNASISSAVDSLADLEPSRMSELFHPPI